MGCGVSAAGGLPKGMIGGPGAFDPKFGFDFRANNY
jgi:hypothetical protein